MEMQIKKAALSDLPLLMEWRMRVLKEVFALPDNADMSALYAENERYYRESLRTDTHTACFACLDGRVIGCGGICYQMEMPSPDNPGGTCGYLMNIYALPEHRGKGVGKAIVSYLTGDAKRRQVGKLSLESSDIAEGLYLRMGFEKNGHFYLKYL